MVAGNVQELLSKTFAHLPELEEAVGRLKEIERLHLAGNLIILPDYLFARRGSWVLRYEGQEAILDGNLKGPVYLRYLLQRPGQPVHVARMLADLVGDERIDAASDAGDLIDEDAVQACRQRISELEAGEPTEAARIEIDAIRQYLKGAIGLGGRPRKGGDDVSKLRRRIAKAIDLACEKIEASAPLLARHLRASINAHTLMSYEPDRQIDWIFH